MKTMELPAPSLNKHKRLGVSFYTDEALFEACGVRIAFTCREGGSSKGPFCALNLGSHVGDSPDDVAANRILALRALGIPADSETLILEQVHGSDIFVAGEDSDSRADAAIVPPGSEPVAVMLFFADCVPVIAVAPDGAYAVIHSGWRGVMARNAIKAMEALTARCAGTEIAGLNIYIGPCIRRECFEVGDELRERFIGAFGDVAAFGESNVDLPGILRSSFEGIGADPSRICDLGICTVCNDDEFFSYRASDGVCGRHAAIGYRNP